MSFKAQTEKVFRLAFKDYEKAMLSLALGSGCLGVIAIAKALF
jgi:hypothetical protein